MKVKFHLLSITSFIILLSSCKKMGLKESYLALGDSYTVGESISKKHTWPKQLVDSLKKRNVFLSEPRIIAKTGWTTDELKKAINDSSLDYPYDWVSLLIGVNNQYRGRDLDEFKLQFESLLFEAIAFSGNRKERVFVISLPDWGSMPFAKDRDPNKIAIEIDNFNQIIYEVCAFENIKFIDITPISRNIYSNPNWIAKDSLHPSKEQYSKWVEKMIPYFLNLKNG